MSSKEVRLSPELSALLKAALRGRTQITREELEQIVFCAKHGPDAGYLVSVCEEDGARLYKCGCEVPPQ